MSTTIGDNIRRIRMEHGYLQVELAERAGVTPQMLNQIEWGVKSMTIPTLLRITAALGCSADDILFAKEDGRHGAADKSTGR